MNFSHQSTLPTAGPVVQAVFRLITGFLFACHGAASLFGVLGGAHGGGAEPALQWPGWWAALIELVGGILVALGLFTRIAAVICSGSMAYAYFSVHQANGLLPINNGGEPAVQFCWAFLLIACLGPGAYAVGSLWKHGPAADVGDRPAPVSMS
ncbi:DoxX family protein [Streptomyces sp. NBC_00083]|uniref:DoxX family protein n=1 Tax=Streptomyces sp. NBC_00083 TaxID=2975647 RepID=UPI0022579BA2|nr:DoxX family protein [Streptomyces sp. NBC_00083]MCX5386983.1 DoxX family protein [Streptomyces sp. NBC_00083]